MKAPTLFFDQENTERISEMMYSEPQPWKQKVLKYLTEKWKVVAAAPCANRDMISGEPIQDDLVALSDGEYCWRSDLAYYVEKYDVILDDKFVEKAVAYWEGKQ